MQVRNALPVLGVTAIVLAASMATFAAPVAAATTWTAPKRIPGTVGLVNPLGATAPDGTDLALWRENTGVNTQVALRARVRLPGSARWRDVPISLAGSYLQDMVIAPTPSGDFWVAYQVGVSGPGQQVRLSKLDSERRTWSKAVKLFNQQTDYGHAGAAIAVAGDGTIVVTAYAPPFDPPPGDPVYRVALTTRKPGGTWQTRFLSPASEFAAWHDLAANDEGDIVVALVRGYDAADQTVWAATKGHKATAKWKIRPLSDAGDGYRPQAAIGDDGTAAVVWSASASSYDAIQMATIDADRRLAPWVGRNVVTGTAYALEPHVVVAPNGQVTVVWRRSAGGRVVIWERHLAGETLSSAVALTPADKAAAFAAFNAFPLRPDGKAALLYQLYTPPSTGLGLRFLLLDDGVPGPARVLTGDAAIDGEANTASLGIDGRNRATVIYTRGTYPDTEFVWLGQVP